MGVFLGRYQIRWIACVASEGLQLLISHGNDITTIYENSLGLHACFMSHTNFLYENIGEYNLVSLEGTITSLPLPIRNVGERLIIRGSEFEGCETTTRRAHEPTRRQQCVDHDGNMICTDPMPGILDMARALNTPG
ncbi:hypothetical protein OCU04_007628 [Sclerotinia nivalis]|uniref:Uncharacterized protein n=1 Tax=Sclerotinia nivalis TaxID=352851 RepID=A0A9X0DHI5_9HELO|nr:hypothetical protein OCU04_007628 [Sclerotinia nivalis]